MDIHALNFLNPKPLMTADEDDIHEPEHDHLLDHDFACDDFDLEQESDASSLLDECDDDE